MITNKDRQIVKSQIHRLINVKENQQKRGGWKLHPTLRAICFIVEYDTPRYGVTTEAMAFNR